MGRNTSIALGDHFEHFVDSKVSAGRFKNASEVIRAGLRLLEEEESKVVALKKALQEGIASGRAQVGMSREGVLLAMGRPPFHANPSLDVPEWMYWRNRFARVAVQFDDKGKVINVR